MLRVFNFIVGQSMFQIIFVIYWYLGIGLSSAYAGEDKTLVVVSSSSVFKTIGGEQILKSKGASSLSLLFELKNKTNNNEWVSIKTSNTPDQAVETIHWLKPYEIELVVQKENLEMVLDHPYFHTKSNGLRTLILPGQPMEKLESGAYRFKLKPLNEMGPVPEEYVGNRYTPQTAEQYFQTKGIKTCGLDKGILPENQGCWSYEKKMGLSQVEIAYQENRDGEKTAFFRTRTGVYDESLVLELSKHASSRPQYPEYSELHVQTIGLKQSLVAPSDPIQIISGTPIYWSNGETAGVIGAQHTISADSLTQNKLGIYCLDVDQRRLGLNTILIQWKPDSLKLCFDKKSLRK